MPNTIILKKSSVAGKVPLSTDLTFGEVALNYADGKIYYKNTTTNIDFVGNGGTFTNRLSITNSTQSTNTTTGALTVTGGVGIGGNLNVAGTLTTFDSRISIGTAINDAELTISAANQDVISALSATGTNIHVIGTNNLISRITQDSFGTGTYVAFTGRSARGTAANPTASQAGDLLAQFTARGYATTSTGFGTNSTGRIDIWAEENHTDSARGTYITLATTTPGTISPIERFRVEGSGTVKISHLGATSNLILNNAFLVATSDVNSYSQMQIQNKNAGTSASVDFIATTDDGSDTTNYIDLGINNSQFNSGAWTVSGPRDGYLYVANNNLTIGTDSPSTTVKIHVGGIQSSNVVATFNEALTPTTSPTTGALVINGGLGVGGDIQLTGTLQGTASTATNADKWTTARTITLAGDLSGSINIDGSTNVTLTATISADSVALGTDTTGIYIASGAVSGFGLSGSANTEGSTFTVTANSTSSNTTSTIVFRDGSGNFSAGTITASLNGTATTATSAATAYSLANTATTHVGRAVTATFIDAGSASQIIYKNASNITTGSSGLQYDGVSIKVNGNLESTFSSGDEGGEIQLAKPATNTTLAGPVSIDIYQNKLRFFETGGSARGFYIDITSGAINAGTDLVTGTGTPFNGGTITGALTINNSTSATSTTSGALQIINGGAGIGGNLVANQVWSVNNGNGTNFKVGDDAWIGDINNANTIGIRGQQDSTQAYIVFGDSNSSNYIGRSGTNPITVTGPFNTTGVTKITDTSAASSTITGALVVTGGVGVGGAVYIKNTSFIDGAQILTTATVNSFVTAGVSSVTAGTDTVVSTSTGAVTIWNNSTLQTITNRGATTNQSISITNTTAATSTTTGALIVSGGAGIAGNAHIGGNIVVKDTAIVGNASTTSVLTSAVTIDSFAAATYRSAQYIVSISNPGLGEYQTSDVLIVHNGTNSFVQATSVFTGNKALLNFSTTISGGNVLLQGTGNQTGANANVVKIQKTYITV